MFALWGEERGTLSSCAFGCAGTSSDRVWARTAFSDLLENAFRGEALGLLRLWGLWVTFTEVEQVSKPGGYTVRVGSYLWGLLLGSHCVLDWLYAYFWGSYG